MTLLESISSKVTNVVWDSGKQSLSCGCPVCIRENHDKQRNHLKVWANGAFKCNKYGEDREHNRAIRATIRGDREDECLFESPPIQESKIEIDRVYSEDLLGKLISDYSYWIGRGISEATIRRVQGGLSPEGKSKLSGRFLFPCRDETLRIIGWDGRLVVDSSFAAKWKIIGPSSRFLFPSLPICDPAVRAKGQVILTESVGDSLSLLNIGIDNILCLFGCNLSAQVLGRLVAWSPKHIIIATNNDAGKARNPGKIAADKIKLKLSSFFPEEYIEIRLPAKKDLNDMTPDEILEWYNPPAAPASIATP